MNETRFLNKDEFDKLIYLLTLYNDQNVTQIDNEEGQECARLLYRLLNDGDASPELIATKSDELFYQCDLIAKEEQFSDALHEQLDDVIVRWDNNDEGRLTRVTITLAVLDPEDI